MKLLLLSFIFLNSVFAVEVDNGLWLGTFSQKKLTDKYSLWIETQVRYNLDIGNTSQVLYRTGVLQNLNQNQGLGYLYAFIQSGANREHRLTLQHTANYGEALGFKLSHRARLESRFLEETTMAHESAGRLRYLFRADQLNYTSYGLVIWDEVFLNTNETAWNGETTTDRNRFFIGFKKMFFDSNRMEFGYLNQFTPRESEDVSEHIATFYFFF